MKDRSRKSGQIGRVILANGILLAFLAGFAWAAGATKGSAPSADGPAAATDGQIAGVISYSGATTGTHLVWVGAFLSLEGGPPAYSTVRQGPGPYTLTAPAGTYYIMAGMDADDSGGAPNPLIDPIAPYTQNPVTVTAGALVRGVDIALHDPGAPAGGSIAGYIAYSGHVTGAHSIIIVAGRVGDQGPPAYHTVIGAPGGYTLTAVTAGDYLVMAFMDMGGDMGPPGPDEPLGWYDANGDGAADAVRVEAGAQVQGIDIALRDPRRRALLPLLAKRYGRGNP